MRAEQQIPRTQLLRHPSRRRTLLALVALAGVAELAYAIVNFSAMPPYLRFELGLGAWVGAVGAAFLLAETVLKSPLGLLSDRFGRKRLLLVGPLISAVTAPLTVVVHHPLGLLLLRALDGAGAAALWPTIFAAVADAVEEKDRSTAMSLLNVTYLVGIATGPLLGGVVNDLTGTRTASFYLAGALFLLATLVCLAGVPARFPPQPEHRDNPHPPHISLREMWESAKMVPDTLLLGFISFFGIGMVMLLVKLYAMEVLHLSESGFGLLLLPPAVVFALASVPAGRVGDLWGRERAMKLGVGLAMAGMWFIPFVHSYWVLLVCGSIVGVGYILAIPAWMALVSEIGGNRRGAVMGAVFTAQGVGAMLGAPLGAYLYDRVPIRLGSVELSSHITPFLGTAVALTISFFLTLWFFRDGRRPPGAAR
ncbi:MAG: MFS transporter [Armatimonadota bacterium]|nr:MFS transporter [bacterium]MCS7308762.1 MFS transporter [Armatimonadota bacterium]MDW8103516.1 MFS transporter [Armatimonadota bacterium]MDW8289308.1 MFS transporter [Armatimonadota bacterium]